MGRFAFLAATISNVLALGAALAHAYALPNKIGLTRDDYVAAQQAYEGWNSFAFVLSIEATALIALLIYYWRAPPLRRLLAWALGFFVASQVVFWAFTFPANLATEGWTQIPDNWAALRARWEYSHLAGAVFQLSVFFALLTALLREFPRRCDLPGAEDPAMRPQASA